MRLTPKRPLDLPGIRAMVSRYGAMIGAPDAHVFDTPRGDGSPYIVVGDDYRFIVEERGIEFERRRTRDLDQLLYWIFDGITFTIASRFATLNRHRNEDPRRLLFAKQEEVLGQISARWREWKRVEHDHVLIRHPFDDARFRTAVR